MMKESGSLLVGLQSVWQNLAANIKNDGFIVRVFRRLCGNFWGGLEIGAFGLLL